MVGVLIKWFYEMHGATMKISDQIKPGVVFDKQNSSAPAARLLHIGLGFSFRFRAVPLARFRILRFHYNRAYNGDRVFPGGKERPGRDADPSPLLVTWSRKNIPLFTLWAVRPVQSLSTCTRAQFTLTFTITEQNRFETKFGSDRLMTSVAGETPSMFSVSPENQRL